VEQSHAPTSGAAAAARYRTCSLNKGAVLFLVLAAALVSPLALALFATLAAHLQPAYQLPSIRIGHGEGLVLLGVLGGMLAEFLLLCASLLVLHEYCHGLGFQWAGAKPCYGAKLLHKVVPIFYAASPGFRTSCGQFRVILLAPTVVVNLIGVTLMWPPTPLRYLLVLPMAVHLAGCMGDWWMLFVLRNVRAQNTVEDTPEGFRYEL
jgi:hypothetical protein